MVAGTKALDVLPLCACLQSLSGICIIINQLVMCWDDPARINYLSESCVVSNLFISNLQDIYHMDCGEFLFPAAHAKTLFGKITSTGFSELNYASYGFFHTTLQYRFWLLLSGRDAIMHCCTCGSTDNLETKTQPCIYMPSSPITPSTIQEYGAGIKLSMGSPMS